MTSTQSPQTGSGRPTSSEGQQQSGSRRPVPPAAHYLFALLITLIVTGLAFPIEDAGTKWIVFTVGVVMDLSILLAWAVDPGRRRASSRR